MYFVTKKITWWQEICVIKGERNISWIYNFFFKKKKKYKFKYKFNNYHCIYSVGGDGPEVEEGEGEGLHHEEDGDEGDEHGDPRRQALHLNCSVMKSGQNSWETDTFNEPTTIV